MTTAAIVLWVAAALMFGWAPLVLVVAWVTERLDARDEAKRRAEQQRVADAQWLALLAVTGPSLAAHPTAERIRARIAANEASRIDDAWGAVSREWSK